VTAGLGRWRHCGRLVPATPVCRACGYDADPERNRRARFVWGLVGALLTLTVVGAPVGLPCLLKARGHHRATTGRVVVEESRPSPTAAAARAVRRQLNGSGGRHGGGG
jgi:predicted nucleic acid-binding Zn ribbon protein